MCVFGGLDGMRLGQMSPWHGCSARWPPTGAPMGRQACAGSASSLTGCLSPPGDWALATTWMLVLACCGVQGGWGARRGKWIRRPRLASGAMTFTSALHSRGPGFRYAPRLMAVCSGALVLNDQAPGHKPALRLALRLAPSELSTDSSPVFGGNRMSPKRRDLRCRVVVPVDERMAVWCCLHANGQDKPAKALSRHHASDAAKCHSPLGCDTRSLVHVIPCPYASRRVHAHGAWLSGGSPLCSPHLS